MHFAGKADSISMMYLGDPNKVNLQVLESTFIGNDGIKKILYRGSEVSVIEEEKGFALICFDREKQKCHECNEKVICPISLARRL